MSHETTTNDMIYLARICIIHDDDELENKDDNIYIKKNSDNTYNVQFETYEEDDEYYTIDLSEKKLISYLNTMLMFLSESENPAELIEFNLPCCSSVQYKPNKFKDNIFRDTIIKYIIDLSDTNAINSN